MATIRKRSNRYQVQVRRNGFPALTKSFHKLSDAKEWARHIETRVDRKDLGPDRRALAVTTLSELVIRYRDSVLPHNKGGHVETIILNAFLRHPICRRTLADLSTSDFAAWRDEKLEAGDGRRAITAKSVKRLLSPLQHMFSLAIEEWGVPLPENPLARFKLKVVDNKRQRRLRDGELDRLMLATRKTKNPYLRPIIMFALETAMRRGEILAMRWTHVDLERRSVLIPKAKNGHSRTIPLSRKAIEILNQLVLQKDGIVFPVKGNAVRLAWDRLTERAGLVDLHFHDLRHEAISRLFELGLTVPEAASISGHKDIRMLLRYAHADTSRLAAKLDV